jgi:hypothetical protein
MAGVSLSVYRSVGLTAKWLLALASKVILDSEFHGTHGHILL